MIRRMPVPVASLSDCPVWWPQLIPMFSRVFPRTIEDAILNDTTARVNYLGTFFYIIPETMFRPGSFSVWGPAHVNQFPDSI